MSLSVQNWTRPGAHLLSNVSVPACAVLCKARKGCVGFEVFDPDFVTCGPAGKGSTCYTYSDGLALPFTRDKREIIRTCTLKADDVRGGQARVLPQPARAHPDLPQS